MVFIGFQVFGQLCLLPFRRGAAKSLSVEASAWTGRIWDYNSAFRTVGLGWGRRFRLPSLTSHSSSGRPPRTGTFWTPWLSH